MLGKKHYQEQLFSTLNLSKFIPSNHLLVRIDKALKLEFIYELTHQLYCQNNG